MAVAFLQIAFEGNENVAMVKYVLQLNVLKKDIFLKHFFFLRDLPLLAVFIIFVIFCHQVVFLIHLVFKSNQGIELTSKDHVAQTVSPRRSPLDQGASLEERHLKKHIAKKLILKKSFYE